MSRGSDALTRGEWCVLALVDEGDAYGWALSRAFAPGGEIHQYWSGDRQRVYRSLRSLEARGLIKATGTEPGERGRRTVFATTEHGREALTAWLSEPATNVKDVHNSFLLKLVFAERAGLDTAALIADQRECVVAMIEALERELPAAAPDERLPLELRARTIQAVLEFIDSLAIGGTASLDAPARHVTARTSDGGQGSGSGRGRGRHGSRRSATGTASDLTGREIEAGAGVTLVAHFADPVQPPLVATAHRDDPLVRKLEAVGRRLDRLAESSPASEPISR